MVGLNERITRCGADWVGSRDHVPVKVVLQCGGRGVRAQSISYRRGIPATEIRGRVSGIVPVGGWLGGELRRSARIAVVNELGPGKCAAGAARRAKDVDPLHEIANVDAARVTDVSSVFDVLSYGFAEQRTRVGADSIVKNLIVRDIIELVVLKGLRGYKIWIRRGVL